MALRDWSTTAANNNQAAPNGAPEGMAPSGVNNSMREIMAQVRGWYEAPGWTDLGHTPTRIDNDTFTVATDLTTTYVAGRRLKFTGGATSYGTVLSSSYSAPTCTVNVTMDSGNLPNPLTTVALGYDSTTGAVQPYFRITDAEIAAGVTPVSFQYEAVPEDVRRQGAVSGDNSTSAINAALNATDTGTVPGGAVWVPGDANTSYSISDSVAFPKRVSGDNHSRWYTFKGMGRGAARITAISGMANKPIIDASGTNSSTQSYYREISDLYLAGASIAETGINMSFNQHFRLNNIFINGLKLGTGSQAAGILLDDIICADIIAVKVHNGEGYGIIAPGGSGNFTNASLFAACTFLDLDEDSMYISGGFSGNTVIANTFESCGGYGLRFSGYSAGGNFIGGNYIENNDSGDIYLGENNPMQATVFEGNYLNGYVGGTQETTYTPIKVKYGNSLRIAHNQINVATAKAASGYYIFDGNVAGGAIYNTVVDRNYVGVTGAVLAASTAPNQLYNLPANWVDNGNAVIDPQFVPLIRNNINRGRFPFGGWTLTFTNSSTIARSADMMGSPAIRMTRAAAPDSCQAVQAFTVGKEYLNRFVTVACPVKDIAGSGTMTVTITSDGTSPVSGVITVSGLAAGAQRMVYSMGFVPSDATYVQATIVVTGTTGTFEVGHVCVYVGAEQWYDARSDQHWVQSGVTAPTTGTWAQGDIIWRSDATTGAAPGIMCTVAGTPGTWKAMANLA